MGQKIVKKTLLIDGMTCINCENKIKKQLKNLNGVENVKISYETSKVEILYDESYISLAEIEKTIESREYSVVKNLKKPKIETLQILGILFIILALFIVFKHLGYMNIINAFPTAKVGMGYGMLFLIGILTSLHCLAMCGGINLSQCVSKSIVSKENNKSSSLKPSLLYNSGRIISYTIIGGLAGGVGSAVTFDGSAGGIVIIIAGIFMVIMGLNMLNIFPSLRKFNLTIPKFLSQKINMLKKGKTPFYVGLLNGLMPCGPLQAMQLYALSTGDPIKGALSMFFFSLGTMPLMFGLGALSSMMSKSFTSVMMKFSAILIIVMGTIMFSNGMNLSGFSMYKTNPGEENVVASQISRDVQNITTKLERSSYEAISVKKDVPVRWVIQADEKDINGCNEKIVIPEYDIEKELVPGDNVIMFTPDESGVIPYSCWMGMIDSDIIVE